MRAARGGQSRPAGAEATPPYRAPEWVRSLPLYAPAAAVGSSGDVVHLASNENPLGPSPRALEALAGVTGELHRYPDAGAYALRRDLAAAADLEGSGRGGAAQVVVGNGSGELIELLCRTFVSDGERVVLSAGSFLLYRIAARAVNAEVVEVPLTAGSRCDLEALAEAAVGGRGGEGRPARLVFLANPNNPTGTFASKRELDRYFDRVDDRVLTVVDQAYQEYVDHPEYPDALEHLRRGRNVVVLGTFSKIHGLAGLRLGFAFGPAPVLEPVERVRNPFNTSALAQAAARAALADREHLERSRRHNAAEKAWLAAELTRRGLPPVSSVTNFVMVELPGAADEVARRLLERGVAVRPLGAFGLPEALRVTVGTRAENLRFLESLDTLEVPA